ncbi:GntR family transcriptional regulator [Streptomyces hygroscopicus]|uniref:GntR family transcriptional regulator n=1 Tax=Streptomyces hygroscopicus TaxID=1912 RepID=UPI00099E9FC8|nr:GntR family transcriptional regulator [Streptomyces hygroscopicus]
MSRDDRGPHGDAGGAGTLTDELRKLIVSGVYPPGHRLIQEELADRFGVSRIPAPRGHPDPQQRGAAGHQARPGHLCDPARPGRDR